MSTQSDSSTKVLLISSALVVLLLGLALISFYLPGLSKQVRAPKPSTETKVVVITPSFSPKEQMDFSQKLKQSNSDIKKLDDLIKTIDSSLGDNL